jgi:hypothetical protein
MAENHLRVLSGWGESGIGEHLDKRSREAVKRALEEMANAEEGPHLCWSP